MNSVESKVSTSKSILKAIKMVGMQCQNKNFFVGPLLVVAGIQALQSVGFGSAVTLDSRGKASHSSLSSTQVHSESQSSTDPPSPSGSGPRTNNTDFDPTVYERELFEKIAH